MSNRWILLISIFILLLLFFCYLLYAVWGGKYYLKALKSIDNLPVEKQSITLEHFNSEYEYLYSGILMGVFEKIIPGVWVWGEKGPKFFKSDEFTVYSYNQICLPNGEKTYYPTPTRTVGSDIHPWGKSVEVGDFIVARIATVENGGNVGNLREALAYDWWVFNSSIPINIQCEK